MISISGEGCGFRSSLRSPCWFVLLLSFPSFYIFFPLFPFSPPCQNPLENSAMVNYRGKEESSLILKASSEPGGGRQGGDCVCEKLAGHQRVWGLCSHTPHSDLSCPCHFKHTQTSSFRSDAGERTPLTGELLSILCPPKPEAARTEMGPVCLHDSE